MDLLKTPRHVNLTDGTFEIPNGFMWASIRNKGTGTAIVKVINADGEELTLSPGESVTYPLHGRMRTKLIVDASGAGNKAEIVYES